MINLKTYIANRKLNAALSLVLRDKRFVKLDAATTAGIIWNSDQKDFFDLILTEFEKAGIVTKGLCYEPTRKGRLTDEIIGFTKKQTSIWTEIPKSVFALDFMKEKFDILVDLTIEKYFPLIYVTALSEASFKIGYAGTSTNYFDLNIEFASPPESQQLAEQIIYYLKRINKTTLE
jgi:hypothetical protein